MWWRKTSLTRRLFFSCFLPCVQSWGQSMGLSQTPRERLIEFYNVHNPAKAKDDRFLDKTLRKWRGRENELFRVWETACVRV